MDAGPAGFAGVSIESISCPSTVLCLAVDQNDSVLIYDGTSWTQPTRILPDDGYGPALSSISCPSAAFCVAVGSQNSTASTGTEVALTYTRGSWSRPIGLAPFSPIGSITVSCPGVGTCVAVDGEGRVFSYKDGNWSAPVTIDPRDIAVNNDNNGLTVSCASATYCVALDLWGNAFTFNGITWSSPYAAEATVGFTELDCPTTSFCLAGGLYNSDLYIGS